ncbi:MAG: hypothetical protein COB85_05455 [Bacteroidetes bacterium]|nr:MAG: hypothetical protein COB85_05455 [Bacteroidota bacterium]
MLKHLVSLVLLISICASTYAQKGTISGKLVDHTIGEPLIGATVLIGEGIGTITDLDGNFSITADYGDYTLTISYVGFEQITKQITLDRKLLILKDLPLKTTTLTEVQVVADVARERETPVAFSNILPAKIAEELAAQDIPMILNSTPGVYATQQGGGDGDARVTIRGFSQRNVAVMIDGVPVNDMENGRVYWSNWFGLDAVTRSIQVQRGLGASKIAIPSVGGTLNILTKGIDQKRSFSIKQEVGSYGHARTSLGYNSGRQENGWGYTFAVSYKQRNGYADATFSRGFFYFGKIQKMIGNHIISLTALGAPQKHGQRSFQQTIGTYSEEQALNYMDSSVVNSLTIKDKGLNYNPNWGKLNRLSIAQNGDTILGKDEIVNEKLNYYHKPQFSLKDFWNINSRLSWSNMLYLSVGRGGGTGNAGEDKIDVKDGQLDYQKAYNNNISNTFGQYEHQSTSYLSSSINNHMWYGLISTLNYAFNDSLAISGGIDLRYYKGTHYKIVYDLLGGDVVYDSWDKNNSSIVKREGDKIGYYNDGIVKWMGGFAQAEYKAGLISAFVNVSAAYSGYKRIDYFRRKDLIIDGVLFEQAVNSDDIFFYNGSEYIIAYKSASVSTSGDTTFVDNPVLPWGEQEGPDGYILNATTYTNQSKEARFAETKTKWIPGFTVKGGLNYNLSESMNAFFNLGYISKAPRFRNVISFDNTFVREIENEKIIAFELGYGYKHSKFAGNLNAYYTIWKNKPLTAIKVVIDDESYDANINGINALHMGVEVDFIYKALKGLDIEGVISLGNWKWNSGDTIKIYDEAGTLIYQQYFNAKGVHVGDAAQSQYGLSVRYEIKNDLLFKNGKLYVKGRFTYFDRHYANFNAIDLDGSANNTDADGNPRESWLIPNYFTVDFHAGYGFNLVKSRMDIRFSLLNVFNTFYISDAQNNSDRTPGNYSDFDAKSASVFVGMPIRYSLSLKITI